MTTVHMCESCRSCFASCNEHDIGKMLCGYCGVWCTACNEQIQRRRYDIGDLVDVCEHCYTNVYEKVNENSINVLSNIVMGYLVSNADENM